jgi:translation initiation factor 1
VTTPDPEGSRPVYSTDVGRVCPDCGRPAKRCACRRGEAAPPAGDGTVRVRLEVKGRRGKSVTTITGIPLGPAALRELARALKRKCGAGGSVKDGVIEIQGDRREAVIAELQGRGFQVKEAGGR